MKTNISALLGLIAEKEKYLNNNVYMIRNYATSMQVEELDGKINIIADNKEEFDLLLKGIEDTAHELSNLKRILYEKNNEFKLKDGRSIQGAIVDNKYLRKLKTAYEELLLSKNSKKRVTEVNNSYFECTTVNFDPLDIRKKIMNIDNQIRETDFEISKLNSIEFEI